MRGTRNASTLHTIALAQWTSGSATSCEVHVDRQRIWAKIMAVRNKSFETRAFCYIRICLFGGMASNARNATVIETVAPMSMLCMRR